MRTTKLKTVKIDEIRCTEYYCGPKETPEARLFAEAMADLSYLSVRVTIVREWIP